MAKEPRHNDTIKDGDVKGRIPKGAQYLAQKGMTYRPSDRDQNRKARKQAKRDLRRDDY